MGVENNIPEDWVETTLGDISSRKQYGYTESASNEKVGPKFLRITDIQNDFISWNNVPYCPISDEDFTKYKLQVGDVVIARTGNSTGATATIKEKINAVFASYLIRFQINKQIADYNFIDFLVRSKLWYGFVKSVKSGSAQGGANANDFALFPINLPPLLEQKAIAKVLTAFDDKIELLQAQNKTLETILKVKYAEEFIVGSCIDWPKVKIGDYVKTNSISINKNYSHDTILYMDTGSLTKGVAESLQELKLSEAPSRAKRLVKHNDILISTVRPNQKHFGLIKYPISNLVVSTGFCVISCEKIDPHFLYHVLTSNDMTEYLHSVAEGSTTTYPSIKPIDVESVEFLLPPNNRLEKFSKTAAIFWDKIHTNQKQVKALTKTRDTILPKLMSGQVRVNNLKQTADA